MNWENRIVWQTGSIVTPVILKFRHVCSSVHCPTPHPIHITTTTTWVWAEPVTCFWLTEYGRGVKMYVIACMWLSLLCWFWRSKLPWCELLYREIHAASCWEWPWATSQKETEILSSATCQQLNAENNHVSSKVVKPRWDYCPSRHCDCSLWYPEAKDLSKAMPGLLTHRNHETINKHELVFILLCSDK